ncbi:hypothetical protein CRI85_05825 [Leuconostoc pseudomesenteroides]|uniref:hypothetical protein n=1 Tax=Leuconostoc pseudomesenteroides TaxID=33968 RepID=UPI001E31B4FF|nr:hypothetical protein [Leuconostoc pseudomesenteroides]MCC8439851.1 hypothetical protein [Leuconostoc pseudomesenteroides]
MLNQSLELLNLSQWFFKNNKLFFKNKLKLQKFLFFYMMFQKINKRNYSLEGLKAYDKGPVFSPSYGDISWRYDEFYETMCGSEILTEDKINITSAKKANFLINILNSNEVSNLTHQFDAWKSKNDLLKQHIHQIPISESDFTIKDLSLVTKLYEMYPIELIDNSEILYLDPTRFVFRNGDISKLTDDHRAALENVSSLNEEPNPLFVDIAEDGVLEID